MQEYLLKVSKSAEKDVQRLLDLGSPPPYVRLSTLASLSNWGYPVGSEGAVLRVLDNGIVTGEADKDDAPHDFVPWQNIAYISDGTTLAREVKSEKR